jgi:hypothetical protein
MDKNEDLLFKVARGHVLKNVLPAAALAMGLAGCDVSPVSPDIPTKNVVRKVDTSNLFLDAVPEITSACQALVSKIDKDIAAQPTETPEIRFQYATKFRRILQPYYNEYDALSVSDQKKYKTSIQQLERVVAKYEKIVMLQLDKTYLKYNPSQRDRYEVIRK